MLYSHDVYVIFTSCCMLYSHDVVCNVHMTLYVIFTWRYMLYSHNVICYIHMTLYVIFTWRYMLYSHDIICYIHMTLYVIFTWRYMLYSHDIICYIHITLYVIFTWRYMLYLHDVICYIHMTLYVIFTWRYMLYSHDVICYIHMTFLMFLWQRLRPVDPALSFRACERATFSMRRERLIRYQLTAQHSNGAGGWDCESTGVLEQTFGLDRKLSRSQVCIVGPGNVVLDTHKSSHAVSKWNLMKSIMYGVEFKASYSET